MDPTPTDSLHFRLQDGALHTEFVLDGPAPDRTLPGHHRQAQTMVLPPAARSTPRRTGRAVVLGSRLYGGLQIRAHLTRPAAAAHLHLHRCPDEHRAAAGGG